MTSLSRSLQIILRINLDGTKFIAETITLRELPTAQPVPMLRMADVELTSVDWLWFP